MGRAGAQPMPEGLYSIYLDSRVVYTPACGVGMLEAGSLPLHVSQHPGWPKMRSSHSRFAISPNPS